MWKIVCNAALIEATNYYEVFFFHLSAFVTEKGA